MADSGNRCAWSTSAAEYIEYHDREWGVPLRDDRELFERVSLEGFQAGLSWLTVLRKRAAFREAFRDFDPVAVASFTESDVQRLLADARIIRHRGKIEAVINNAQALCQKWQAVGPSWLTDRFAAVAPTDRSLSAQGFVRPPAAAADLPAACAESRALSAELRQAGFRFVGPTTLYAAIQAAGFVNDHLTSCFRFETFEAH